MGQEVKTLLLADGILELKKRSRVRCLNVSYFDF